MPTTKAFFAYPSNLGEVTQAVEGAQRLASGRRRELEVHLWVENDIAGRPLTDPIFERIAQSDILFADVTSINFNVTFEIGYAIGLGKRIYVTRNQNFRRDTELIDKIGIFDTLGFDPYSNEETLAEIMIGAGPDGAIPLRSLRNAKAPIYVLNTPTTGQAMLAIISRIKKARLGFKSFIPQEDSRLSAIKAVDDVSAALGVVVPLLSRTFADADVHNIRAAFVAGLALALGKATVILQPSDGPAPLDVRDIVKTYRRQEDIADQIGELALDVTERLQAEEPLPIPAGNFLAKLSIGDPIAENEFQTLGKYYLRTDQFGRASRGEVNIVVGRKGAGKTALFSQLRNEKRANPQNIVVDLKPEGYQLIRLKEDVLDFLAEGAQTHLITGFFEYVLYLEICYKVLEKDKERHTRDGRLYEPYQRLLKVYQSGDAGEGDFSERLLSLSQDLVAKFQASYGTGKDQRLTAKQVTELMDMWKPFRQSTQRNAPQAAILFDKFHILRHLGEALDKIRKAEYGRVTGPQRKFIKGQKYVLLSHQENLTNEGRKSLRLLLKANKRLNTAYILRESFDQLWDYKSEAWARRFFDNWKAQLRWQRLKPYEAFAQMIERHWDGIAAYCRPENKIALGFVEGLNNKIRVIQRRAYGLRDEEYLRLKILTASLPEL